SKYFNILEQINLITISNYVKNSPFPFLRNKNNNMEVIYLGTSEKSNLEISLRPLKKIFINGDSSPRKRVNECLESIFPFLKINNIKCYTACETNIKDDFVINLKSNFTALETISNILSDVDLVIYPSVNEGYGLPIFEALEAGRPVIVYDNKLNRELYENLLEGIYKNKCFLFYQDFCQIELLCEKFLNIEHSLVTFEAKNTWTKTRNDYISYFNNKLEKKLNEEDRSSIFNKHSDVIVADITINRLNKEIDTMKKWIEKQERDIYLQKHWIDKLEQGTYLTIVGKIKKLFQMLTFNNN
ncbi:MAG: glycosyltransferase, partial [Romboutsia sp.]|nr:glycosyltransferase [Romboutsia sp.]